MIKMKDLKQISILAYIIQFCAILISCSSGNDKNIEKVLESNNKFIYTNNIKLLNRLEYTVKENGNRKYDQKTLRNIEDCLSFEIFEYSDSMNMDEFNQRLKYYNSLVDSLFRPIEESLHAEILKLEEAGASFVEKPSKINYLMVTNGRLILDNKILKLANAMMGTMSTNEYADIEFYFNNDSLITDREIEIIIKTNLFHDDLLIDHKTTELNLRMEDFRIHNYNLKYIGKGMWHLIFSTSRAGHFDLGLVTTIYNKDYKVPIKYRIGRTATLEIKDSNE